MASIEYIEKRIEGKRKEIAKLEKKIGRITKAKESNWENNPYYYNENDLKWATKDLEEARTRLEKYMADLEEETAKANSRNVKPIIEFLDEWKRRTREFYIESFDRYIDARKKYYEADKEFCDWFNTQRFHATPEERKEKDKEHRAMKRRFNDKWGWLMPYHDINGIDLEKLDKDLKRESDRKYDFIIERTVAITGTITDATNIHIGADGELNGYIIGEDGTAKVQTIGAGGYNVQRYHFRTLIHKMK